MNYERLNNLKDAIEAERLHEQNFYQQIVISKTITERIDGGYLWYPVQLLHRRYSFGDQIELSFEKLKEKDKPHRLRVGVGVRIFKEGEETFSYFGVVSYLRKDRIKVFVGQEDILHDHRLNQGLIGIEAIYDERPYKIMTHAINQAINNNSPRFKDFKRALLEGKFDNSRKEAIPLSHISTKLNDSQRKAIQDVSTAEYVGVIHGPPGTGKTTTLVELIKTLVKTEKRILVCAPSNNAVDLLAILLNKKNLNVLRVGNVSRVDDDNVHLTLAEKARNHPDWKQIKKVKILEREALSAAQQYKRNFGDKQREDRRSFYQEAKELRKWARDLESRLKNAIVEDAQVICTTLIGASHSSIDDLEFNSVIIDEASQALEPSCWNVILKAERVILAGDHKQLAPVVKSDMAKKNNLDVTLLDRMIDICPHKALLKVQYRMNQAILGFSNQQFYDNKLISDDSVKNHTLKNDSSPLVFIDTSGCGFDEVFNEKNKSYSNPEEYYILREYLMQQREKQLGYSIGMIAPYSYQVQVLQDMVNSDSTWDGMDIEVNTIDGFQGQEKDIIYMTMVRSNDQGNIGFLADERRLNVAMTRARKKLVIIGDMATLSHHRLFRDFGDYVEKNGEYRSAWEFMML